MADPAVHVFEGKLYIYPSHDRESGIPENDNGDHFDMNDYHVFSTSDINSKSKNSAFVGKELTGKVAGIIHGKKMVLHY